MEAGCLVMAARERVGKVDPGLTRLFLLVIRLGWALGIGRLGIKLGWGGWCWIVWVLVNNTQGSVW